jgi:hypothetical protein
VSLGWIIGSMVAAERPWRNLSRDITWTRVVEPID